MVINFEEACNLLRKHASIFSAIPDGDWELLLPHLEVKELKKNTFFVKEGKRSFDVGLVLDGMLRQYYTKDGEEKTTYFFFENHFVNAYISCITGKPSHLTIEALSDVQYISFPYPVLLELYDKSMAWQKFGRLVAEYLGAGLEERMVSLLLHSPEERYLNLLNSNKRKIIERIPQHYIANYLGITPVSLSRIRKRLMK
jgi:CRP-like cAMP-binding protein